MEVDHHRLGIGRTTAWQRWTTALLKIAVRLNAAEQNRPDIKPLNNLADSVLRKRVASDEVRAPPPYGDDTSPPGMAAAGFALWSRRCPRSRPCTVRRGCRSAAEVKRALDRQRPSAARRGYGPRWRRARAAFLAQHPLCAACRAQGRVVPATVVDHVVPHRGDQRLFWDEAQLGAGRASPVMTPRPRARAAGADA